MAIDAMAYAPGAMAIAFTRIETAVVMWMARPGRIAPPPRRPKPVTTRQAIRNAGESR